MTPAGCITDSAECCEDRLHLCRGEVRQHGHTQDRHINTADTWTHRQHTHAAEQAHTWIAVCCCRHPVLFSVTSLLCLGSSWSWTLVEAVTAGPAMNRTQGSETYKSAGNQEHRHSQVPRLGCLTVKEVVCLRLPGTACTALKRQT